MTTFERNVCSSADGEEEAEGLSCKIANNRKLALASVPAH